MDSADYRLVVHMEPSYHDSPSKPYFWCVLKYDEGLHNMGSGWAETPDKAFTAGRWWLAGLKRDSESLEEKVKRTLQEAY